MAIFGLGSNWNSDEMKEKFFKNNNFEIGWEYDQAIDLYDAVSLLKTGDIVYLKANQVGSRTIRVKGIGIVYSSYIQSIFENKTTNSADFFVMVKWIVKNEFEIIIPEAQGKLTNVRAATFYEEYLPLVQKEIIEKLFSSLVSATTNPAGAPCVNCK